MEIRYGRAQADLDGLITDTLHAWDIAIAALVSAYSTDSDLDAPSRRRGSTVRDVLLGIGEWPHGVNLADRRAAAARADTTPPPQRLIDAEIAQRYADADVDRIAAAWRSARDAIESWAPHAPDEAAAPVGGPLGVVPLGTMVGAGTVAIQRTVQDSGLISDTELISDTTSDASPLARIALHSLIDSVGAVCAQAPGDGEYRLAITTPDIEIGVCASPGAWHLRTDVSDLPRLIGPTEMVWQIASGARSPVTAFARREIEVIDIGGLMHVARGLTIAPDLPGGEGLRAIFTAIDGMTSTASKIGSLLSRLRRD